MGTPGFAVPALELLQKHHSTMAIVGVYTQPDRPMGRGLELKPTPIKAKAQQLALPVFQPETLSQPYEFERLKELHPDVIVVVAYGQILKKNILELPRYGCVNIHSSLLPRWRGAAPIQWAILSGDGETGVTTMRLVEALDAGEILMQSKTPISAQDTVTTLQDRLAILGAELLISTLKGLEVGQLKGMKQDERLVTYASKLTKEMEWLDTTQPAEILDQRIRALNPWPGTSVLTQDGTRLKIKKAILRKDIHDRQGQIFERSGMLLLGTPRGALELLSLQWDGKKEVDAAAFFHGHRKALPLELKSRS